MPLPEQAKREWRWIGLGLVTISIFILIISLFHYMRFPTRSEDDQLLTAVAASVIVVFLYLRFGRK